MNKVLSKMFEFLKIILFILATMAILFGILSTYSRLEKSLLDAISIFIPFILLLVIYIVNLIRRDSKINDNLFLNFVSCIVFTAIIVFGVRAKLDTNMVLYHKYGINYNPSFFSDNLTFVVSMLYCLIVSNFFLIVSSVLGKEKKKNKYQVYDMKNKLPEEVFDEKEVVTPSNVKLVEDETLEEEL